MNKQEWVNRIYSRVNKCKEENHTHPFMMSLYCICMKVNISPHMHFSLITGEDHCGQNALYAAALLSYVLHSEWTTLRKLTTLGRWIV